jgi:hypothetical protein
MIISPPILSLNDNSSLVITATLDHAEPVTIYTWPSIFNTDLAQRRYNFFCADLSDDKPVKLSYENAKRSGFVNRQIGGNDDQYMVTFYPGVPRTFTDGFVPAARRDRPLKPGHRYRFGINRPLLSWQWIRGTRDDIMTTEVKSFQSEKQEIIVPPGDVVEFEVMEE